MAYRFDTPSPSTASLKIKLKSRFATPAYLLSYNIKGSGFNPPPLLLLCLSSIAQVMQVLNCLEGSTMSNRGAYSTKERMPSDRELPLSLPAWKAVPDWLSRMTFRDVLPSRQIKNWRLTPRTSSFHSYVQGYS